MLIIMRGLTTLTLNSDCLAFQDNSLDLSTLSLELRVSVAKANSTPLDDDAHVAFSNGLNNTMFKSLFNSMFNYHPFIKMITTIPQDKIESISRVAFYHRNYDGS